MENINRVMREAMQLMQTGDLQAATAAIQRSLAGAGAAPSDTVASHGAPTRGSALDGDYRVLRDADAEGAVRPADRDDPARSTPGKGTFTAHHFRCEAGAMQYKLFVPHGIGPGAPLIVMLHGCTQSPDDFARGTRMNALAQEHGYVIAYPAQPQSRNASKCWNWFRRGDQQRGKGEPAIIAALTRQLVQEHALDARRVYAAGLSAGGAMAAVLAGTYPDVYAAIGVHSGLPFGAAGDLPSALAAMKQGGIAAARSAATIEPVPAIVFHGDRDVTVDRCNGDAVIEQSIGKTAEMRTTEVDAAQATVEHGSVPRGRSYTRTLYRSAEGILVAEHWEVHGAGHAWFGGDPSGTYTDPTGPDASEHMLRFFSGFARTTLN